jgi:hypothetical protein
LGVPSCTTFEFWEHFRFTRSGYPLQATPKSVGFPLLSLTQNQNVFIAIAIDFDIDIDFDFTIEFTLEVSIKKEPQSIFRLGFQRPEA